MSVNPTLARLAVSPATATAKPATGTAKPAAEPTVPDDGSLSFADVIDAVNPLHHLPGVSLVYGAVSGDTISVPAKLVGGFLFGGPMGLVGSMAMAFFEEATGDSIAGHVATLLDGEAASAAATTGPASPQALAEALRRAGDTSGDATAFPNVPAERQNPALLAQLYGMAATRKIDG